MSATAPYRWIHRVWYEGAGFGWLLLPLSVLYGAVSVCRRALYRSGIFRSHRAAVPVIVVGNITAGGTGKTPTVVWLANELKKRGFSPGIVSRGYGGSQSRSPMRVDSDSDPDIVGDEPVLLARRSTSPVVVNADRVRAVEMLIDEGADLIVSDDGMQHYRLQRDYEICVIDGSRGLGNRRLLPAGPLREPPRRLDDVDQLLVNGPLRQMDEHSVTELNALPFDLVATEASRLNGSLTRSIKHFAETTVHAVAGIGNPARFFALLRGHGIHVLEHARADHAPLVISDIDFADGLPVFMTEKDAVKLGNGVGDRFWCVPVDLEMDVAIAGPLLEQIESRLRNELGVDQ